MQSAVCRDRLYQSQFTQSFESRLPTFVFDTKKRKMGNALSIPDKLYLSDDDIINYVRENADLFLDLADELKEVLLGPWTVPM